MLYNLFAQVEGRSTGIILDFMSSYIEQEGNKIVKNSENLKDPIKFTDDLLKLKSDMDNIILISFENDIQF
jgi:hypothetical protein